MDKRRLVLWVLVVLTLAFIFGQSLLSQEASIKESEAIQEKIVEPVHKAVTKEETIRYDIRDVAHKIEFAVLGLELILLLRDKKKIVRWLKAISYCGFVALLDESIQYFSGRAPQVIDIWYDIIGTIIGSVVGLMIFFYYEKNKSTRRA